MWHNLESIRWILWHPTPVLLPGKSHGWRSLEGCSLRGLWGSDTTEWLHFHCSFSCIGKGNGNPLQCSCLENPRDGGAWWAAVYGVAHSWTRLKWLSSSSSSTNVITGSKLGKEYVKAVYCHPAYLTYMQSTSWETLGWRKHKLELRLSGEISITSDMQITPHLWQKAKKN